MSLAGLKSAFNTANKGLHSQLTGLNVTGHNIANVNTEGYSRQNVVLAASDPMKTVKYVFGTGVEEQAIQRTRDSFIDMQYRLQLSTLKKNDMLEKDLEELQTIFNEPSETGLRYQISSFFDNWQELANDPESEVTRYNIREQAKVMAESFQRVNEQLDIMGSNNDFELQQKVKTVNDLSRKIADLNLKINTVEAGGSQANDLRDARDVSLDSLAELMDITYAETSSGNVNVSAGGVTLVSGTSSLPIKVETYNEGGELHVRLLTESKEIEVTPKSGELRALIQTRNEIIPRYRESLNEIAENLITEVNNIHRQGVGLKGSLQEIPHNNDFFSGSDASDIWIDDAIEDDVNAIAVAKRVDIDDGNGNITVTGEPGNNEVGLDIAELKRSLIMNNHTISIPDSFNVIIGDLGIEANKYKDLALNQQQMLTQFQNIRESTSGVSLDEEFTSLIKFQRAYQANAKVISAVDDMYEVLVNMT